MPRLTIPDTLKTGIANLASLSQEASDHLSEVLRKTTPVLKPSALASRVAPEVPEISRETATDILTSLMVLQSVRASHDVSLLRFVDDVCEAVQRGKSPKPVNVETLRSRLPAFLELESLQLTSKASALQREQQRSLISARVITDVRPVFRDDTEVPLAALVNHVLKLSFMEDGEAHDFFVALDDEDLSKIQKVISRAQSKSKVLGSLINKAELSDLSHEETQS